MTSLKDGCGSRSTLQVGGQMGGREIHLARLDALERRGCDLSRLPFSLRILLENLLRTRGRRVRRRAATSRRWPSGTPRPSPASEIAFMPAPRAAAGLHRRARRRRPGRHARRDEAHGRRPDADQSAAAGRAGHRPLGAGRRVRHRQAPSTSTPSSSSSATASATPSCAGARTRSTTSASCRPTPASSTR